MGDTKTKILDGLYTGLEIIPTVNNFLTLCGLHCGSLTTSIVGILHPAFFVVYVHRDSAEKIMAAIGGYMSSMYFIMSILLLIGILIKNPIILALYVYFMMAFVCTAVIIMIVAAIRLCIQDEFKISLISCMMFPLVLYMLMAYMAVVVNSYRLQLMKEGHKGYKE